MNKYKRYKPSPQYINSVYSSKQIVYQDSLFTFTTDDLYIISSSSGSDSIYIYLDLSKYFNLQYHKFNNLWRQHDKSPFLMHAKKKLLLQIGNISCPEILNIKTFSDLNIVNMPFHTVDIDYHSASSFKLIPANRVLANFIPNNFNSVHCEKKYGYTNVPIQKIKIHDRKKRTGHQNMSINKRLKKLRHKLNNSDNDLAWHSDSIEISMYKIFAKKHMNVTINSHGIVYKKAKLFKTIHSRHVIDNPLNVLSRTLYSVLYRKTNDSNEIYWATNTILNLDDNKCKYKLIRMLFVLLSLGKYELAYKMILLTALKYGYMNPYIIATEVHASDVKIDINMQTINIYKKKFDLLYSHIKKYTYNDLFKIDKYVSDYISKKTIYLKNSLVLNNEESNIKKMNITKINSSNKFNALNNELQNNLYEQMRYEILSTKNYNGGISFKNYILPNICDSISAMFKHFARLYDITNEKRFMYIFTLKRKYNVASDNYNINGWINLKYKKEIK